MEVLPAPESRKPEEPLHPKRSSGLERLFILAPLLLLALDFFLSPHLIESRYDLPALSLDQLLSDDSVDLGKVHLHSLRVSLGSIGDGKQDSSVNALILAVFPGDPGKVGMGSFGRAVLDELSPTERARFLGFLAEPQAPGSVQVFQRESPHDEGSLSGIDSFFVIRALPGSDEEALKALRSGLLAVFARAEGKPVSGFLLPCLTIDPHTDSLPLDDFFESLFAALQASGSPGHVNLSFYDKWPYDFLESATASFNKSWHAEIETHAGLFSRMHRFDLRLLLLGLAICLLSSSFHVQLTPKHFLILACSFSLAILGSYKTLDWLAEWYGPEKRGVFAVILVLVEAWGYPYFIRWSAKGLFESREK